MRILSQRLSYEKNQHCTYISLRNCCSSAINLYSNLVMLFLSLIPTINGSFVCHESGRLYSEGFSWKLFAETKTIRIKRARRMNHAFQHLYRHDVAEVGDPRDSINRQYIDSIEYLVASGGFSDDQVKQMAHDFPPLLSLDVDRHLKPKMKFIKHTLGGGDETLSTKNGAKIINRLSNLGKKIPPQFFGARLERTIAPRHAFLMINKLPHGIELLRNDCELLKEFMNARSSKQFASLCNQWRERFGDQEKMSMNDTTIDNIVVATDIDSFDTIFQRGLMAAARNELSYKDNDQIIDAGDLIKVLVSNGGNPHELDIRGISLIHWASGTGNMSAVKELIPYFGGAEQAITLRSTRDNSTILHWSAAGAKQKDFGCGGHIELCSWFVDLAKSLKKESTNNVEIGALDSMEFFLDDDTDLLSNVINAITAQGNSVLMWAAWSGSLDIVELLIENGADTSLRNKNGCTVAHWAASGGHLATCKYLALYAMVDFDVVNYGGNSPLSHAVAFGRLEVVSWLQHQIGEDDGRAALLARDFVEWDGNNQKRKEIMDMFADFL